MAKKRRSDQMRPVKITRGFMKNAEGSALIEMGETKVICSATVEESVPRFLKDTGTGWVTTEYSMLPRSTQERIRRAIARDGNIITFPTTNTGLRYDLPTLISNVFPLFTRGTRDDSQRTT